ncbi:MAG: SAF domain-containing protein [Holosporaceae bacterium]|jgi:Flp pilus assembly protein CpaB|nr:SAF domain-containing protein [Holosporaceae bacterium]
MNGKKDVLPIIIAVGVALVITGIVRWFKHGWGATNQQVNKKELSMQNIPLMMKDAKKKMGDQVLVVKNNIKKGSQITLKDLAWKGWPREAIQPYFIARDKWGKTLNNKDDYNNALKMWAASDISIGMPLTMNMLSSLDPKSAEELEKKKEEEEQKKKLQKEKGSTFIKKGMRAVTFVVDQRSASSSALLFPENLVDVLIMERQGDRTKTHKYRALKILAIDGVTKFESKKSGIIASKVIDSAQPPKNVTLEIKEENVDEMLRLVGNNGIILSLRNQDEKVEEEKEKNVDDKKGNKDSDMKEALLQSVIDMNHANSVEALKNAQTHEKNEGKNLFELIDNMYLFGGDGGSKESLLEAQRRRESDEAKLAMLVNNMKAISSDDKVEFKESKVDEKAKSGKYEIVSGKISGDDDPEHEKKSVTIFRKLKSNEVHFDANGNRIIDEAMPNAQNPNNLKNVVGAMGGAAAGPYPQMTGGGKASVGLQIPGIPGNINLKL